MRTLVFAFLLAVSPALALEPGERLADPALEARARAISAELRCLVCQNESIDESNAGLARDVRRLVRERLAAGDTDREAVHAVVSRYGDFVLLRPPVKPATWLLWFGPAAVLVVAAAGTALWVRRRAAQPAPPVPLSADEQARLNQLLRDGDR